jgi:RNA polymerase sigma-70 factor, ECF subfamily
LSTVATAPSHAADTTASLYSRHSERIRSYCVGRLRDRQEADDAVQSTFLYAFALLQRGVTPKAELPWLYTIAHNVCRTRRRSLQRRRRVESTVALETIHETVGRDDPAREDLGGLGTSLASLPEAQRRALLLREWQGLSYAEIAQRLELSESAVEAVLFRARRNLAQKMQQAASVVSAIFVVRSLRRLSPFTAKAATTAAVVASLGAGAALQATKPPQRPPREAVEIRVATPSRPQAAHAVVHRPARAPHPRRTAPVTVPLAARTSAPAPSPIPTTAPTSPTAASAAPEQPTSAGPPAASAAPEAPAVPDSPPQVVPPLPPAVQDVVDTVQALLPEAPNVEGVLPPPVAELVDRVTTTVNLPQKGSLLQGRP